MRWLPTQSACRSVDGSAGKLGDPSVLGPAALAVCCGWCGGVVSSPPRTGCRARVRFALTAVCARCCRARGRRPSACLAGSHDGHDHVRFLRCSSRGTAGSRSRMALPGGRRDRHPPASPSSHRRTLADAVARRRAVRHRVAAGVGIRVSAPRCAFVMERPIALGFYGVFVIAALWHAPRSIEITLARYAPPHRSAR